MLIFHVFWIPLSQQKELKLDTTAPPHTIKTQFSRLLPWASTSGKTEYHNPFISPTQLLHSLKWYIKLQLPEGSPVITQKGRTSGLRTAGIKMLDIEGEEVTEEHSNYRISNFYILSNFKLQKNIQMLQSVKSIFFLKKYSVKKVLD